MKHSARPTVPQLAAGHPPSSTRRVALDRAQRFALALAEQAERARVEAMTPAERASDLSSKAAWARHEARELEQQLALDEIERERRAKLRALIPARAVSELEKAVAAAQARAAELTKLGAFAAKYGAPFVVAAAIASPITLDAARNQVMDAMAAESERYSIRPYSSASSAQAENHAAGWDRALSTVAARRGVQPAA